MGVGAARVRDRVPAAPPTPQPGPDRRRRPAAGALAPAKRLELHLQAVRQLLTAVCSCSSASSRSRSVSARACLALGADRRELRLQALALHLHLGNLVLELLHLPLRHQLLVLSRLRTRASCSWLSAALQLASRFLEAIRGYARARPVRGDARRPPQPGAATSTVGSAAPRCLRRASGVGAGRVEAGLDSQAVGR